MFIQTLDHSSHCNSENRRRIGDFGNFLTVLLKAHACFDSPEYWMSAICMEYCEKLHSVRGLYDKNSAS